MRSLTLNNPEIGPWVEALCLSTTKDYSKLPLNKQWCNLKRNSKYIPPAMAKDKSQLEWDTPQASSVSFFIAISSNKDQLYFQVEGIITDQSTQFFQTTSSHKETDDHHTLLDFALVSPPSSVSLTIAKKHGDDMSSMADGDGVVKDQHICQKSVPTQVSVERVFAKKRAARVDHFKICIPMIQIRKRKLSL